MIQNDSEILTPEEKWKNATIANNFIFYKVMRNNPEVCKELLEILLEMEIDHIEMILVAKESVSMYMLRMTHMCLIWKCRRLIQKNFRSVQGIIREVLMSIV